MNHDALRWTGGLLIVILIAPVVLYLLPGSILGFFLPCGDTGTLELVKYADKTLSIPCSSAELIIGLLVAFWGTSVLAFLTFLYGYADISTGDSRPR